MWREVSCQEHIRFSVETNKTIMNVPPTTQFSSTWKFDPRLNNSADPDEKSYEEITSFSFPFLVRRLEWRLRQTQIQS